MSRGRPRKQANRIATQRFGIVLDELKEHEKITQAKLAKRIHTSQQSISKLKRGEIELSVEHAKAIAEAFPQYRIEWLLGLDGFKTQEDLLAYQQEKAQAEAQDEKRRVASCFKLLAEQLGYQITESLLRDWEGPDWEHATFPPQSYSVTKPDGAVVRVPYVEMEAFRQEVLAFLGFKLDRLLQNQEKNRS